MKIGAKLGVGFGVVSLLLVVAGVTGILALKSVSKGYSVDVEREDQAKDRATQVVIEMLEIRQSEKDFLLYHDLKYFEQGKRHLSEAARLAGELKKSPTHSDIKERISEVLTGVADYGARFDALVNAWQVRGLDEGSGLQGEFRNAAHHLEAAIEQNDTGVYKERMLRLSQLQNELKNNFKDPKKCGAYYEAILASLREFKSEVSGGRLNGGLKNSFLGLMAAYESELNKWVATIRTGKIVTYNEVRKRSIELEEAVFTNSIKDGRLLLLALRKEEKDYLLRGDQRYAKRCQEAVTDLKRSVEFSRIAPQQKREILALLDNYLRDFSALVAEDLVINRLTREMNGDSARVSALAQWIMTTADKASDREEALIHAASARAIRIVWISSSLSLLIALVFAYFFSQSIARPLSRAFNMIADMEAGNLDNRLDIKSDDEIGRMAKALDAFAEHLKYSNHALLDSKERYRQLFQSNPLSIFVCDSASLALVAINESAVRHYGYSEHEFLAMTAKDLCAPVDIDRFTLFISEVGKMNKDGNAWKHLKSDGSFIDVELTVHSFLYDGTQSVLMIANDITEQLQLREEAMQASRLASLGELSAGVAHEINNPTGMLLVNLNLIKDVYDDAIEILDEHQRENGDYKLGGLSFSKVREKLPYIIAEMQDGARRIKRIVEDLKGFARPDSSSLRLDLDLNKAVQTSIRLAGNQLKKATLRLVCSYEENLPPVNGNIQQIEQVMVNLLMNACQALPDNEKGIFVSTCSDRAGGVNVIVVRDEGVGIDPKVLPHITDPFFTTKRENGGMGLGLSLSARIVREHGGTLQFSSTLGEGTTITLKFPISKEG